MGSLHLNTLTCRMNKLYVEWPLSLLQRRYVQKTSKRLVTARDVEGGRIQLSPPTFYRKPLVAQDNVSEDAISSRIRLMKKIEDGLQDQLELPSQRVPRRRLNSGKGRDISVNTSSISSTKVTAESDTAPTLSRRMRRMKANAEWKEQRKVEQSPQSDRISIFKTPEQVRSWVSNVKRTNVALVPTMGALHDGHMSLIRMAARESSHVIVSIYVNPTQFGMNEDLDKYPKTLDADMKKLNALNAELDEMNRSKSDNWWDQPIGRVKAVFVPDSRTMYPTLPPTSDPAGNGSFVTVTPQALPLEGSSRPVFFRGVATVCMKLFNIVRPACVVFGRKDVQQLSVITRMVQDFFLDITVKPGRTVREENGLAMSSRNVFLGARRRNVASVIFTALRLAQKNAEEKKLLTREEILGPAQRYLNSQLEKQKSMQPWERALFEVDYLSMADFNDMQEVQTIKSKKQEIVVSIAVKMLPVEEPGQDEDLGRDDGWKRTIRLIDNVFLRKDKRIDPTAPRVLRPHQNVPIPNRHSRRSILQRRGPDKRVVVGKTREKRLSHHVQGRF